MGIESVLFIPKKNKAVLRMSCMHGSEFRDKENDKPDNFLPPYFLKLFQFLCYIFEYTTGTKGKVKFHDRN